MVNRNGLGIRRDFEPTLTAAQLLEIKRTLARNLAGGVIVEVATIEQARVAEQAGAVAVMALGRDLDRIEAILQAVRVPVMAQVHSNRVAEALALQEIGVGFIEEIEALDQGSRIDKAAFNIPFISEASTLDSALRHIHTGATMIRTENMRLVQDGLRDWQALPAGDTPRYAADMGISQTAIDEVVKTGQLPVATFVAIGSGHVEFAALRASGFDGVFIREDAFSGKAASIAEIVSAMR